MQCKECGGIMNVINAGMKTSPFLRRRRQCDGCKRKVTTFESVYDPASGEHAEHLITRQLTYSVENLITAFRSLTEDARDIVLELAQSGELPFNSPTLLDDIQMLEGDEKQPGAPLNKDGSVRRRPGPAPRSAVAMRAGAMRAAARKAKNEAKKKPTRRERRAGILAPAAVDKEIEKYEARRAKKDEKTVD